MTDVALRPRRASMPARRSALDLLPAWATAAALLALTAGLGSAAGSIARPVFILGCVFIGYQGWKQSPEAHMKALLALFCFAPLVRRIVDLRAGYDTSGIILVGPLLTAGLPLILVFDLLTPERLRHPQVGPVLTVAACVLYGTALTMFKGEWMSAISNGIKSIAPLAYATSLMVSRPRPNTLIDAATSAFIVILPLMGLYGIWQYIDPPEWDRFWMKSATILSAGQPLPFEVRTFSVLNGPASFATYTAGGMLLVFFLRPRFWSLLLMIPAAVALMLSMYRTAWIEMAVGILFCLAFRATRTKAAASLAVIAVMIAGVIVSPFGDAMLERFSSLTQGAGDGSAQERMAEFMTMWMLPDSGLIGQGFTTVDVGSAGSVAIDGMLVSCWVTMGLVVGLICIGGLFWAIGNAIMSGATSGRDTGVTIGALALGALVQLPLANIISAELGTLFWAFAVMIPAFQVPAPYHNPFREGI